MTKDNSHFQLTKLNGQHVPPGQARLKPQPFVYALVEDSPEDAVVNQRHSVHCPAANDLQIVEAGVEKEEECLRGRGVEDGTVAIPLVVV